MSKYNNRNKYTKKLYFLKKVLIRRWEYLNRIYDLLRIYKNTVGMDREIENLLHRANENIIKATSLVDSAINEVKKKINNEEDFNKEYFEFKAHLVVGERRDGLTVRSAEYYKNNINKKEDKNVSSRN